MLTTDQILQQGRYRIVNHLGQNGIGVGYEAFDNNLGANVLLKEIHDSAGKVATPAQLEARKMSFSKKAKFLTEMKHESLLLVKNYFSEIDRHYLVTELINGNTLGELLEKKKGAFPLTDISNWADQLLDALNYLHTLNPQIIHGEVKPQNIRLSSTGKVKLLTFNLVQADEKINMATANQTFDAAALPYLPLEQIWDGLDAASRKVILTNYDEKSEKILEQPTDSRSDVYSLAATLYHLLTARIPVDALTRSIDILEGKADPLQSPSQINSDVPKEVSDVLIKALEIKRENRFSSAVIMRQVLRTAFVRVKEREATVVKPVKLEDDAVLEIPVVEPKPVVAAPVQPAAPKNPEMESQLELIKQQLRKAEEQRLEAERRAAEAEKRLLEAEKHISIEPAAKEDFAAQSPVKSKDSEDFAPGTQTEAFPPAPKNEPAFRKDTSNELPDLFAEPEKESGGFKKIAAAAAALIVLGGAGFGIWTFTQSKSSGSSQTISTTNATIPPTTTEAAPAPTTEPAPASSYQATTDPSTEPNNPSSAEATAPTNPTGVKPKTVATPPPPQTAQVKKTAATPAKTAENQKKVTLDDLLKDN